MLKTGTCSQLLKQLEHKVDDLTSFYESLGYRNHIFEFIPEEILENRIKNLYNLKQNIEELIEEYPKFIKNL